MTITPLTSSERARLRAMAHELKPVQHIGKEGVTEAVLRSVDEAFRTRELVKIRVLETAPGSAREIADAIIAARPNAQVVQTIGRVAVLYLPQEEAT